MEMLLMLACMSLFATAIMVAAFSAATRPESSAPAPKPVVEPVVAQVPARVFKDDSVSPAVTQTQVPIEALLLQIENHIRLEQAAAESFVETPTPELLHSKTISSLVM